VEALKDGMAETPDAVLEYADVIYDRTMLLEERINDLIHFARLQTTDWQARFAPFPLKEFLDETCDIFRNDSQIRKRQFESDLAASGGRRLRGDRKMVFQVLENLFDNSCRYSGEGDIIRLSSRIEEDRVVISMEDSGPGVHEDHVPFIFNNFYRADQGRNSRGLGVGLDSAKTIVRIHGGDIGYEPSSLGGARFVVILPLEPEP
jgi:signal transduction histidine kinase